MMWLLLSPAFALPFRAPPPKPAAVIWEEGRLPDVAIVKFIEGSEVSWAGRFTGRAGVEAVNAAIAGAKVEPLFETVPPRPADGRLADLSLYFRVTGDDADRIADALNASPLVEIAYLAPAPVPPPADIPPTTDDFRPLQTWLDPFPGLGFTEAALWPGGLGEYVTIADLEYSWDPSHEDLDNAPDDVVWGWSSGYYAYHGNGVLGQLIAGDNGYGVTGAVPGATAVVISPFDEDQNYTIAESVLAAVEVLSAGDVLLIEQQGYFNGDYCPVSYEPAVFDAISYVVEAGIVVVEPGGNGSQDLDHPSWEGWFDRSVRDSGSIMVGGGASPESGATPRSPYPFGGSSHGSRIDVQAWYDSIVTVGGEGLTDLYYPERDLQQAYTSYFGGTSGASPMITALAAILQSVRIAQGQAPLSPFEVRAALVSIGTPQTEPEQGLIGPQPDLRRLLRTYTMN